MGGGLKKTISGKGPHRECLCKKSKGSDKNCRSLSIFANTIFFEQNLSNFRQFPVDCQKKTFSGRGPTKDVCAKN